MNILLGTGRGAFALPLQILVGSRPTAIIAEGIDRDGRLDLATADAAISVFYRKSSSVADCDGDGVPDSCELRSGTTGDCNLNGIPDNCDIASGLSRDNDQNGIPDRCDGGRQVAGDCNQDGMLTLSDPICLFGIFFLGERDYPCGDGSSREPANVSLFDWQQDGRIDLSDGVAALRFLFLAKAPHVLGAPSDPKEGCRPFHGCPDRTACP